ncbi:MAG TPA: hypothetical protein VH722_09155 [Alphaproteobacteria bacterium]|nr:hypothetical protein [Alphaproteobacteria bacterium]
MDLALERLLDALEAELLAAPEEDIRAAVAETGMKAGALLVDPQRIFASPLEGEVSDAKHQRVGGMSQPSRRQEAGGDSTPLPDLWSDLPLRGGGE